MSVKKDDDWNEKTGERQVERMYKHSLLIAVIIGFAGISACAEIEKMENTASARGVRDNVFYSSSPKMQITVQPDIAFLGAVKENNTSEKNSSRVDPLEQSSQKESYLFADISGGGILTKGVLIRTYTLRGNPNQDLSPVLPVVKNKLDEGVMKILGDEFEYYTLACEDLFTPEEKSLFAEHAIPGCFLVKALERTFGLGNKSRVQILYYENILAQTGSQRCDEWDDPETLSAEQKTVLDGFLDRSYANIRFAPAGGVVDKTSQYVDDQPDTSKGIAPLHDPDDIQKDSPDKIDIEPRLQLLKDLRDKDLITQEEYENKKAEILEGL